MEFYEVINNRKTIREFEDETIPADMIERIIAAAFKAPTNDHMRDWHFIIVKETLIKSCASDTQSDFSSDCIKATQAYCRMARSFCVIWRKICK